MADIQFDTAAPVNGLISGFKTGLDAGTIINAEKRRKQELSMLQKKAEEDKAFKILETNTSLLEKNWVPGAYKLELYNKNVKPVAEKFGMQLPEMSEWNADHNKVAKNIFNIISNGKKERIPSTEMLKMIGMELTNASKETREAAEPLIKSLETDIKHQETLAKDKDSNNKYQDEMNRRAYETKLVTFSKNLEDVGAPTAVSKLNEIYALLPQKGKDIPGYGVSDSTLPDLFVGDKGRAIRQKIQGLANIQIKDRSGASVTDNEFTRFVKEFGQGKFKTEQQMRDGLDQAVKDYKERISNVYSGYAPQVKEMYFANPEATDYLSKISSYDFGGTTGSAANKIGRFEVLQVD